MDKSTFNKTTLESNYNEEPGFIDYLYDFDFPDSELHFHWWDKPSASFHTHNYFELFVVTKGSTLHTINGVQQKLHRGSLSLILPEDQHMFTPILNKDRTYATSQHINLSFTPNKMKLISNLFPYYDKIIDNAEYRTTILTDSQLEYFLTNAQQINILSENATIRNQSVYLITLEMIFESLAILYKNSLNINPTFPSWFNELIQKLHDPESLSYSIKDIYSLSHYSPPMLVKYFKEYTGETIVSYFTKIKMQFACNLLRTTNFSVLEISNRVYFDSISHFNYLFKQYTGVTPLQYRQQYKDK